MLTPDTSHLSGKGGSLRGWKGAPERPFTCWYLTLHPRQRPCRSGPPWVSPDPAASVWQVSVPPVSCSTQTLQPHLLPALVCSLVRSLGHILLMTGDGAGSRMEGRRKRFGNCLQIVHPSEMNSRAGHGLRMPSLAPRCLS